MIRPKLFLPDQVRYLTAKQAGNAFPGLAFVGPGWYKLGESWLLMMSTTSAPHEYWSREPERDSIYCCCLYEGRDPRLVFKAIELAPTY